MAKKSVSTSVAKTRQQFNIIIDTELRDRMKAFPELRWGYMVRRFLQEKLAELEQGRQ